MNTLLIDELFILTELKYNTTKWDVKPEGQANLLQAKPKSHNGSWQNRNII